MRWRNYVIFNIMSYYKKKGDGSRDVVIYNSENWGGLTVQKACDLFGGFGKLN